MRTRITIAAKRADEDRADQLAEVAFAAERARKRGIDRRSILRMAFLGVGLTVPAVLVSTAAATGRGQD
jgi:hypothetical protein